MTTTRCSVCGATDHEQLDGPWGMKILACPKVAADRFVMQAVSSEVYAERDRILAAEAPERLVEQLGERIGYGHMMQLAERLWNAKQPGGAHSVGPCVSFLVACACVDNGQSPSTCEWCCGSGRVTERVRGAIEQHESSLERY